jgi:hypothetical protein
MMPQLSDTPQATFTPNPTRTLTPSKTTTPTPTISEWEAAWTATTEAKATEVVLYHVACDPQHMFQALASPDENWLASGCSLSENVFIVASRDGSKSWSVPAGHEPGQWLSDILKDTRYCDSRPVQWSNDSRYAYFFLYYCMAVDFVPDYAIGMSPNFIQVLYRMDTQTGVYNEFTPSFNSFSFSPLDRYLLCITRYGNRSESESASIKFTFINLETGETMHFWLGDTLAVANVIWSEDGNRIFFVAEKGIPWFIYTYLQTHPNPKNHLMIYEYNLEKGSLTLHFELPDLEGVIYPTAFSEDDNTLALTKTLYTSYDIHEMLVLDLSSHQLVTPAYTPTP